MRNTRRLPALTVLVPLALAACNPLKGDHQSDNGRVSFGGDSISNIVLESGDVMITSSDGSMILAALGDSVRLQLSDSMRRAIKQDMESSASDSKLASMIVKGVSDVVQSALSFVVQVPVTSVEDLRYEEGRIRFRVTGENFRMSDGKRDGNNMEFSEEDARRFIEVVKARQEALTGKVAM